MGRVGWERVGDLHGLKDRGFLAFSLVFRWIWKDKIPGHW